MPTVLWIHGGGWILGSKDLQFNDDLCTAIAAQGLMVVSCNYYLSTFAPCNANSVSGADYKRTISDVKRVIRWIRTDGDALFDFPDQLVVAGSSAGAHLAAMMAVTCGTSETFYDPPGGGSFAVDYAILYSPPLNFVTMGCEGIAVPGCSDGCRYASDGCVSSCAGVLRRGNIPHGYPCAGGGSCYESTFQEALLGRRWNPANPPLAIQGGTPQNPVVYPYDCSDAPPYPTMPTQNRWYDASPFYWASGNEPRITVIQQKCDAYVSSLEGYDFESRVDFMNSDASRCNVIQIDNTGAGDCTGCMHAAEAFGASSLAGPLVDLIEDVF